MWIQQGFSTQMALLYLIEKWRFMLYKKGYIDAIASNVSKVFGPINHKLNAHRFSKEALKLIFSYLKNKKQRVKINKTFSSWKELLCGAPQGSVLGSILFFIYLKLFFIFKRNICL